MSDNAFYETNHTDNSQVYLQLDHVSKMRMIQMVLMDVNLEIKTGRIIGMVGDNGIGKTTLLKIIAGLQHPTDGTIQRNVKEISYVCKREMCYPWMKGTDVLALYRDSFDDFDYERAKKLIVENHIPLKYRLKILSEGQSERLFLILALCRRAKVYLLDEPLSGLDPHFKKDFRQFLLHNISEDSTVIIATHLLKDLEQMFDEVIFLTEHYVGKFDAETIRGTYHKSVEQFYLEDVRKGQWCQEEEKHA